jgi:glycosyltransferase involved in cell wall biosynthesis
MKEGIDLCVADFLVAMPNVPGGASAPVMLFEHNVEYMIWKRLHDVEKRPWRRALLAVEWRKMRRYEARACTRAAVTVAVSEADRALLAANAPAADIRAIPTGVDTSFFHPNGAIEAPATLVFTGSMDWYPNEDAVMHFIEAILPEIRQEVPGISLAVVGRDPSSRLRAAGTAAGIRVTGTVEDVRPHVAEAAVYVVPLRVGGGTRLKIFEALAMGKAVVSTRIGAEGLPIVPGQHFLQADEPADFARAVVALLRDPARRRALGLAGRRLMEERYSWTQVAREFERHCEEAVSRHAR